MKPHITSIGVCQSLSFNFDFFWGCVIKKFSCKSFLIAFRYSACFHVWYLTFIASYAKSIEKVRAIANDVLRIPSANNAKTVTLLATHVWKDGNHHDMKIWSRQNLFSTNEYNYFYELNYHSNEKYNKNRGDFFWKIINEVMPQ